METLSPTKVSNSVSQWISSSEILLPSHSPHFSIEVTTLTLKIYLKAWEKTKTKTKPTSESQPHSSPQAGLHFKLIPPGWPEKPQTKNLLWFQAGYAPGRNNENPLWRDIPLPQRK